MGKRVKLGQKEQFKKQQNQLVIWLVIKLLSDLIGNKIVTNHPDKEIPKERFISLEEREQVIGELRIIWYDKTSKNSIGNWWFD